MLNNSYDGFVTCVCLYWSVPVVYAAKAKAQRSKAFLRVLKYSTGGVLEVLL